MLTYLTPTDPIPLYGSIPPFCRGSSPESGEDPPQVALASQDGLLHAS